MGKAQVMVVEDEGLIALSLEKKLIDLGYDVPAVVASGEEAIRKALEAKPDIILMDIRLKGETDGVAAASRIRTDLDVPIVYLTAYSDQKTIERAKTTQPYSYLIKPFEERELFATIEMALYKHGMEKKLKASEKWFSTTLRSLGDGVIATNPRGRVTFVNTVAEKLTGWQEVEGVGNRISKVFRIVKEETRDEAESPVLRALKEGVVARLADDTTLISRDGTERSIDDCAAPIVDNRGDILGAVVIFKDVSEKRSMEKGLQRHRKHLLELVDEKTKELVNAKNLEELANRTKREFLANMGHELKTPLNHIIGFTEMVLGKHCGELNETQEEYLNDVLSSGKHLLSLIDDLFTLSRLEAGEICLEVEPFNLRDLLIELELLFSLQAARKGLRLHFEMESGMPAVVLGDHDKLSQILLNLIGNAIKFTEKGEVSIEVGFSDPRRCGDIVRFNVADTGVGVSEEDQGRIFQNFEQSDSTVTKRYTGMGVGLAICQKLIGLMGGNIWLESTPGKGSRFSFTVCLPPAGPQQ